MSDAVVKVDMVSNASCNNLPKLTGVSLWVNTEAAEIH